MARTIFCQAIVVLGAALLSSGTAESGQKVIPQKPKIPVATKLPDLYIPQGKYCIWDLPTYDYTKGILSVAVGNKGKAASPSCSLRIKEYRSEEAPFEEEYLTAFSAPMFHQGWPLYKEYFTTVPALAPGQQVAINVNVAKWDGGFDSFGHPIKHQRKWIISVNYDKKVKESDTTNNGCIYVTYK